MYNVVMNSKEKLMKLEETGKHVFHGSADGTIKKLEPRQGKHITDISKPTETILDGNPAVSATPYSDIATFRALVNNRNIYFSHHSGFGIRDGKKEFRVSSEKVLDAVKDKKGFVYVFNKDEFEPYSRDGIPDEKNMEWRSYKEVEPIDVIEVDSSHLPPREKIKILDKE
jgi:hypothetical protein